VGRDRRVSIGLLCTSIDLQPTGQPILAAADHVARRDGA
jgi:hypothetical protein